MSIDFLQDLREGMWDRQNDVCVRVMESAEGRRINDCVEGLQKEIIAQAKDGESAKKMVFKLDKLVAEEMFIRQDSCYMQGLIDGIAIVVGFGNI